MKKEKKPTPYDYIVDNIDESLTQDEKARYIYLELGKKILYDINMRFNKHEAATKDISQLKDNGVCVSMSKLYKALLSKVGIKADVVCIRGDRVIKNEELEQQLEKYLKSSVHFHVYNIVYLPGKKIEADLSYDLDNIKNNVETTNYNISSKMLNKIENSSPNFLKEKLPKISLEVVNSSYLEKIDKKIGYLQYGMYKNETYELISEEFIQEFKKAETYKEKTQAYFKYVRTIMASVKEKTNIDWVVSNAMKPYFSEDDTREIFEIANIPYRVRLIDESKKDENNYPKQLFVYCFNTKDKNEEGIIFLSEGDEIKEVDLNTLKEMLNTDVQIDNVNNPEGVIAFRKLLNEPNKEQLEY